MSAFGVCGEVVDVGVIEAIQGERSGILVDGERSFLRNFGDVPLDNGGEDVVGTVVEDVVEECGESVIVEVMCVEGSLTEEEMEIMVVEPVFDVDEGKATAQVEDVEEHRDRAVCIGDILFGSLGEAIVDDLPDAQLGDRFPNEGQVSDEHGAEVVMGCNMIGQHGASERERHHTTIAIKMTKRSSHQAMMGSA